MEYFAASDTGRVRQMNEDFCFATAKPIGGLENLFVVCDGMGGHRAGEYASSMAVQKMISEIRSLGNRDPFVILNDSIEAANGTVYQRSRSDPQKAGMGTTLVAATILEDTVYVANVGDSRLYIQQDGSLKQITRDHSYVQDLVRKGLISKEEARFHKDRNKITRAVGVLPVVRIDFFDVDTVEGMQVLLCSDGLSGMLFDDEIEEILLDKSTPKDKVGRLISEANERGGRDNISAVLVEV